MSAVCDPSGDALTFPGRRGAAHGHEHHNESFRLRPGDVVTIDIPGIGPLTNPVVLVGRDLHQE